MTPDPEFARQIAWLGQCSDDQIRRRAEDELDSHSVRPLFLALVLLLVSLWGWSASAATVTLTCRPSPNFDTAASCRAYWGTSLDSLTNHVDLPYPAYKASLALPAPSTGSVTYYVRAVAVYVDGGTSQLSAALTQTVAAANPNPTMLLTVGGEVFQATPNYVGPWPANGWKLGSKVGTIAPRIKCDATRQIGADYFLVKGPIVWTAGKKNYVVARCVPS